MERYIFIGVTVALTVTAQIMLKWRALSYAPTTGESKLTYLVAMYSDFVVLFAFAFGVLASVVWSLAIQRTPLSIAYPFMALSFALVPLASVLLFRETLSLPQIFGILMVVAGVSLNSVPR